MEARIKSTEKGLPPCPKCANKATKEEKKLEAPIIKSKETPPDWAVNPTTDQLKDHLPGKAAMEKAGLTYKDPDTPVREDYLAPASKYDLAMRDDLKLGTFKLGDLPEHRYSNPMNWEKGGVPHDVHARQENPGLIVGDTFDVDQKRFLTPYEIMDRDTKKFNKEQNEKADRPAFVVKDRYIDDWTGTKWAKHPYTYGVEPWPPVAEALVPYLPPKEEEPEEEKKDDKKPKEAVVLWMDSDLQMKLHHQKHHKKHHHHKHYPHHHSYLQEEDSLLQMDANINIDADEGIEAEADL